MFKILIARMRILILRCIEEDYSTSVLDTVHSIIWIVFLIAIKPSYCQCIVIAVYLIFI